jgi:hypothetical protein
MTELPPDVRDRAAEAAYRAWAQDSAWGTGSKHVWRPVVDAVAEVLAAEQVDELAKLDALLVRNLQGRQRESALKARVDLLTAALTELVDAISSDIDGIPDAQRAARAALSATPTESEASDV